jgi:hypothetical protein
LKKLGVILCDELTVGVTVGVGVILGDELTVGVGVGVEVIVGVGDGLGPHGSPIQTPRLLVETESNGSTPKGSNG